MKVVDKKYDEIWKSKQTGFSWRHEKAFWFVEPNSKVLEIGAGNGVLAERLTKEKNCRVVCVDISAEAVKLLKKKKLKAIRLNVEEKWPFKVKEFDYIIALELLEHLFDPEKLLQRIAKTTNYAVFSVPNATHIKNRFQLLFGKVPSGAAFRNGQHLHYWNFPSFINLIEKYFKVVDFTALGSLPFFTKFLSFKARGFVGKVWPNLLAEGFVVKAKAR